MTAKTIPAPGEAYLGGSPHTLKVMKVTYGYSTSLDVTITAGVTSTKTLFSVPAGCLVDHMEIHVATAFNTTGVSIGDTVATSGWFAKSTAVKVLDRVAMSGISSVPVTAATHKNGRYYAAAVNISAKNKVVVTTGALNVYLYYSMAPKQ